MREVVRELCGGLVCGEGRKEGRTVAEMRGEVR